MHSLYCHQLQVGVRGLGPGRRALLRVAGCSIGCPQCCSPETHDRQAGTLVAVDRLLQSLQKPACTMALDGLSISGGEATEQSQGVLAFIQGFRKIKPDADVLLYSGLRWPVLQRDFASLIAACDAVISEPFVHRLQDSTAPLIGSTNQQIHLLTDVARTRYPDYLARPRMIQIYKLGTQADACGIAENPDDSGIGFTGVPSQHLLRGEIK